MSFFNSELILTYRPFQFFIMNVLVKKQICKFILYVLHNNKLNNLYRIITIFVFEFD